MLEMLFMWKRHLHRMQMLQFNINIYCWIVADLETISFAVNIHHDNRCKIAFLFFFLIN